MSQDFLYLKSTVDMLKRAFPDGVGEDQYQYLLRACYDHYSDRNLAKVMELAFEKDYYVVLNDVYGCEQVSESSPGFQQILRLLKEHGFDECVDED